MVANNNIPLEYAKFFKIRRAMKRKAVSLDNDKIIIGVTEVGFLVEGDLVGRYLHLILPKVSVSMRYDKVPYKVRPVSVPKVSFYEIVPTENFLKIIGLNTYYSIPISEDCKIEDEIVIPYLDNYIVIRLNQIPIEDRKR
ncbi:MAG: hypothetical protein JHC31_02360 [Sulfurihydrogenibium sp.]|jgi:hypothetical protein|nr:hypothetical protein [Sulfurihydrogenibium sp.]